MPTTLCRQSSTANNASLDTDDNFLDRDILARFHHSLFYYYRQC